MARIGCKTLVGKRGNSPLKTGQGATRAGKALKDYFNGWNHNYTGPDADGIYPLLKPATA